MSALERTWWFSTAVTLASVGLALFIVDQAGMPGILDFNGAQWILYLVLSAGLHRCFSFLFWLLVLFVSPSTAAPVRAHVERTWPRP